MRAGGRWLPLYFQAENSRDEKSCPVSVRGEDRGARWRNWLPTAKCERLHRPPFVRASSGYLDNFISDVLFISYSSGGPEESYFFLPPTFFLFFFLLDPLLPAAELSKFKDFFCLSRGSRRGVLTFNMVLDRERKSVFSGAELLILLTGACSFFCGCWWCKERVRFWWWNYCLLLNHCTEFIRKI